MKYYKKKDLNKYFLSFKNVGLEREFMLHKQNFRFAKMLVILSIIWNVINQIQDPNILQIFIIGIAGFAFFVGLHYLPQRFKQFIVFIFQVYTSYQIASAILTPIQNWQALVNGASFMMLVLVEYQNIVMESLAIVTCLILPITLLNIDKVFTVYLITLGIILIAYRYQHVKQERLLFLALKNFERWQIVVENTVPAHFVVQSFVYRTHSIQLYDSSRKFQQDFIKVTLQKGLKKSDFNEKYISVLKQLQIENIIQKGKIQPIQFPFTEKPTLYDYLLDKHALLYENQNDEKSGFFNINIPFSLNNKHKSSKKWNFNCFSFSKKKKEEIPSKSDFTIDMTNSKLKRSTSSKIDIGRKLSKQNSQISTIRRQSTSKKSNIQNEKKKQSADEYVEVSFYNEKQNQMQYFKVCIVPLLLQEPLLAISMEDITFISLYHQKMQQTKQQITLSSLSYVKLKQKVDNIISQIQSDQFKLKKEALFVSHIVRAFTRIDPQKITFKTFSVSQMIDEIRQMFPCVYRVKYKNDSTMPLIVEKKDQKEERKHNNANSNIFGSPKARRMNKNSVINFLQNSKQRVDSNPIDLTQLQLLHQTSNSPQKVKEPVNGIIFNHLNQYNMTNNLRENPSLKLIGLDGYNDIDKVILSQSDAYIMDVYNNNNNFNHNNISSHYNQTNTNIQNNSNDGVNNNHLVLIKSLLNKQRKNKRNLSHPIPFSQECRTLQKVNSLCTFINSYEQTMKDRTLLTLDNSPKYYQNNTNTLFNISEKDSKERINSLDTYITSSRCRLNSNFTNQIINTEESLLDRDKGLPITTNNIILNHNNNNFNNNKKSQNLSNSQKKFGNISEILGVVEEKEKKESKSLLTEDTCEQEFFICNNKSMIYYVLVGVISLFKDKKIELIVSLNQSNLYKSLRISISPCIKMTLSKKLTYYQPESLFSIEDIYELKNNDDAYNYSLLSDKLFSRLNEICLLLGPNKIKQEHDLIEIEFFVDQNKINNYKQ